MMPLVLVVDGVAERRNIVQYTLEQAGNAVETLSSARALNVAEQLRPAAIVIATELPDGNGIDLCHQIRQSPWLSQTRIVLLADNKLDRYRAATESCADACVSTPLAPGEIAFVINSVLAGIHYADPASPAGDIRINSSAMSVTVRGKEIATTALEFRLIDYMARHQGEAFSRDALLDAVWGDLQFVTPRSVDACVRRVRRKIEPNSSSPTFLKSVRGVGYKLDATPVWETSADCLCPTCSAVRLRAKTSPIRHDGRNLNPQVRTPDRHLIPS